MPSETQNPLSPQGKGNRNVAGTLRSHHAQLLKQTLLYGALAAKQSSRISYRNAFSLLCSLSNPRIQKPACVACLVLHSGAAWPRVVVTSHQMSFCCSFNVCAVVWQRHRNFWLSSPKRGVPDLGRSSLWSSTGFSKSRLRETCSNGAGAAPAQQGLSTSAPFLQRVSLRWEREHLESCESHFLSCILIFRRCCSYNLSPCLSATCVTGGAALVLTVPFSVPLPTDAAGAAGSAGTEPGRAELLAVPGRGHAGRAAESSR